MIGGNSSSSISSERRATSSSNHHYVLTCGYACASPTAASTMPTHEKEHSSGKRDSSTTVGEAGADGGRLSCERREREGKRCMEAPSVIVHGQRTHDPITHSGKMPRPPDLTARSCQQTKTNRAAVIKAHATTSGGISKNASAAEAACDADPWQAQKSSRTSAPKSRHCYLCSTRPRRPAHVP